MGLKVTINNQRKREDGTSAIRLYISRNGKHAYHSIKNLYCDPKHFKDGRVKNSHPNANIINAKITNAYYHFEQLMLYNETAGISELIALYEGKPSQVHTLYSFIEQFIEECRSGKIQRSSARQKNYVSAYRLLKEFSPTLDFGSINKEFYMEFTKWMRQEKKFVENTVGHKINVLKTFLNEANERNIYAGIEHKKKYFKSPDEETDSIYLSEDELQKLIDLNLENHPALAQERDRFLVSSFLLLRWSDSVTIERSMFYKDKDVLYFKRRHSKTKEEIIIPVKKVAQEILNRNNYKMNFSANIEANLRLKDIGKLAGFFEQVFVNGKSHYKWELITTHTARRSTATNMYLSGIDLETVMKLGGWRKRETLLRYIRVTKIETARAMANHTFFN